VVLGRGCGQLVLLLRTLFALTQACDCKNPVWQQGVCMNDVKTCSQSEPCSLLPACPVLMGK
jgi:hypothetical protein